MDRVQKEEKRYQALKAHAEEKLDQYVLIKQSETHSLMNVLIKSSIIEKYAWKGHW